VLCGPYGSGVVAGRAAMEGSGVLGATCELDGVVLVSVEGSIASGAGFDSTTKASGEDGRSSEEGWDNVVIGSEGFGDSSEGSFVV